MTLGKQPAMVPLPAINHFGQGVDPDILKGPKRDLLRDFYQDVFGWEEMPQWSNDEKVVFQMYRRGQFVNLLAGPAGTEQVGHNHMGIQVPDKAMMEAVLLKARDFKETRDPSVEVGEMRQGLDETEDPPTAVYGLYVQYLLPFMIELQCREVQA